MMLPITVFQLPSLDASLSIRDNPQHPFAAALDRITQVPISCSAGFLDEAPRETFLITFQGDIEAAIGSCPGEQRAELARRILDMDAKWPGVYKLLEKYSLAGAVDFRRYSAWSDDPEHESGSGLYGLIAVAERAGMTYESGREFGSERYGLLACRDRCRDLPSLVIHYLTAYADLIGHTSRA
jgi:hypothetical protein